MSGSAPHRTGPATGLLQAGSGVLIGSIVAFALYWLCAFSMAAGGGSYMPWMLFVSDGLVSLLVWPAIGCLLGLRHRPWAAWSALVLLSLSLAGVLAGYLGAAEDLKANGDLQRANHMTVLAVLAFTGAHASAWVLGIRQVTRRRGT